MIGENLFYSRNRVEHLCHFKCLHVRVQLEGDGSFEIIKGIVSMKSTTTLLAILATVFSLSLAACNTVEGVGEDVSSAGNALDEASEDARK